MEESDFAVDAARQACEALRHLGVEAPLQAVPVDDAVTEWSPGHLRTIREQRLGVYEQLGEMTIVLDGRGRILELDDPRHEPSEKGVKASTLEAVERVAKICGLPQQRPMLRAELLYDGERHSIRVSTIPPPGRMSGDGTFERPAYTWVEAEVNAVTGGIWKLRHVPVPRELPPPEPEEEVADGEAAEVVAGGEADA